MAVPALAGEPTWRADARCRGESAGHFYTPPHGIWGGHNELERRRLMRECAAASVTRSA